MSKIFYETGINGSFQFAYYISSVAMTLAFGYRYQYIETHYKNNDENFKDLHHTFKGFTMLLVKSFAIQYNYTLS